MSAEELFDLCNERGRLLGRTKPRSAVHRDGDWHRAFHCWVFEPASKGDVRILLQLRPKDKDTCPDVWDVSVGGHYSAGEDIAGGLREIKEELGLKVELSQLIQAGWRRGIVQYDAIHDREVQDVFFYPWTVDLGALRPDPAEVPAVALVDGVSLLGLAERTIDEVIVEGGRTRPDGSVSAERIPIRAAQLMPRDDGYYQHAVAFARKLAAGHHPGRRRWW